MIDSIPSVAPEGGYCALLPQLQRITLWGSTPTDPILVETIQRFLSARERLLMPGRSPELVVVLKCLTTIWIQYPPDVEEWIRDRVGLLEYEVINLCYERCDIADIGYLTWTGIYIVHGGGCMNLYVQIIPTTLLMSSWVVYIIIIGVVLPAAHCPCL